MTNKEEIILKFNHAEIKTLITCLTLELLTKERTLAHYQKEYNEKTLAHYQKEFLEKTIKYYNEYSKEIEKLIIKFESELSNIK